MSPPGGSAVFLSDAADGGNVHELIDQPLTINLGEDAPLVVIPQRSTHGLVVHVWLVLVEAPQPGHRLAVHYLEHPSLPVYPLDVLWTGAGGLKQGEEELPQIGIVIIFWSPRSWDHPVLSHVEA